MRSEATMYELVLATAQADPRVRAVILNGSRANPQARRDIFQDFDIVYLVTEIESFRQDPAWVDRFGERIIMQLPDDMPDPAPHNATSYAYLMLFADGHRIDLTLRLLTAPDAYPTDSLSVLLLDKDNCFPPLPPPSERDYLPAPPTAQAFAHCCNEFWWVSTYVAKGLWREEILYAQEMLNQVVRAELLKLLTWRIGVATDFAQSPGKFGKHFQHYLTDAEWTALLQSYAMADYAATWDALEAAGRLFRSTAHEVANHFGFDYPQQDDDRVSAYLARVRLLSRDVP